MNTQTRVKLLLSAATLTVYIVFPAYRYYAMGAWMVYKFIDYRRMVKHNANQNQQHAA